MNDLDFDDDFIDENDDIPEKDPFEISDDDENSEFERPWTTEEAKGAIEEEEEGADDAESDEKTIFQTESKTEGILIQDDVPEKPLISNAESVGLITFKHDIETEALFSRSEKIDILSQSLHLRRSDSNQLFSVLNCIFSDAMMLISRHRSALPFSLADEASQSVDPELVYSNGIISHNSFTENMNFAVLDTKSKESFTNYLDFMLNLCKKSLPKVVDEALSLLQDPLVRSHQKLRSMKQRINDLKRTNSELAVQTRHIANRLVKLSTNPVSSKNEGNNNSDVVVHQQRLQKAILRVSSLKESNELVNAENIKLQSELIEVSSRAPKQQMLPTSILELQRRAEELSSNVEQSEDERETSMAQRRVSISRMNSTIEIYGKNITELEKQIEELDNKIRIMTQGKAPKYKPVSRPPGSKIPVSSKKTAK